MTTAKKIFRQSAAGVDWHCERSGDGPVVVLVPSGEGDCASFDKVAENLARDFTVLTFDTPGFSRTSDPVDPSDIKVGTLSSQIAGLVDSLGIPEATFYGCSSGGVAVLDLLSEYPRLVTGAVVHEVAIAASFGEAAPARLVERPEEEIVRECEIMYSQTMNEDQEAWWGLGGEFHKRLERNYVTWIRRYVAGGPGRTVDSYGPVALNARPLTWTIGGLTPARTFFSNVTVTARAGIELGLLMCKHFPQVSIPDTLAEHIRHHTHATAR